MRNVIISFLATGVVQLFNVAGGVLAARLLLPEGRGELSAAILWPALIGSVLYMSLDQAVTYYGASRAGAARRFGVIALAAAVPISLVAMAVGYVLVPLLLGRYGSDVVAISRLYLLFIPLTFTVGITLGYLQARQRFLQWSLLRVLPAVSYVLVILVFWAFRDTSVRAFVISSVLATGVTAVIGLVLLVRARDEAWRPERADAPLLARYSLGVHLAAVLAIAHDHADKALIALFLPAEALGIYVVALSASALVSLLGTALGPLIFSRVSNAVAAEDKARIFGRFLRLTIAAAIAVAVTLFFVGEWLIVLVFGAPFAPAASLLPLLLIGAVFLVIKHSLYSGLKAYARLRAMSISEGAGFAVKVVVLVLFLPGTGVMAAAWAVALSSIAAMAMAAWAMSRVLGRSMLLVARPKVEDVVYLREQLGLLAASDPLRLRSGSSSG